MDDEQLCCAFPAVELSVEVEKRQGRTSLAYVLLAVCLPTFFLGGGLSVTEYREGRVAATIRDEADAVDSYRLALFESIIDKHPNNPYQTNYRSARKASFLFLYITIRFSCRQRSKTSLLLLHFH